MLQPKFRTDKAVQVAARLLEKSGGSMNHLKLIKLMYLIERESLDQYGSPVIYDRLCSLPNGPIVSRTLDLINRDSTQEDHLVWDAHISERSEHTVNLVRQVTFDALTQAEIDVVDRVFDEHGHKDQWALVSLTHSFGEYQDPAGSMVPIGYRDVLEALGKSNDEIDAIIDELATAAHADRIFG